MTWANSRWWASLVVALAGCGNPQIPPGTDDPCDADRPCPEGLACGACPVGLACEGGGACARDGQCECGCDEEFGACSPDCK